MTSKAPNRIQNFWMIFLQLIQTRSLQTAGTQLAVAPFHEQLPVHSQVLVCFTPDGRLPVPHTFWQLDPGSEPSQFHEILSAMLASSELTGGSPSQV